MEREQSFTAVQGFPLLLCMFPCFLACLVHCECRVQAQGSFLRVQYPTHYGLSQILKAHYSNNDEVFSSFVLNAKGEVTCRRTLKGIPRKEGDDLLEPSSFSLAAGRSVNSLRERRLCKQARGGSHLSQNKCCEILSIVSH